MNELERKKAKEYLECVIRDIMEGKILYSEMKFRKETQLVSYDEHGEPSFEPTDEYICMIIYQKKKEG